MSETVNPMELNAGDDKAPEPAPSGAYELRIMRNQFKQPEDGSPYYELSFKAVDVIQLDDEDDTVDVDQVARIRHKFFMSENARYIYKEWLRDIAQVADINNNYADLSEEVLGTDVRAVVKRDVSQRGTPYNKIVKWLKPDAE